MVYKNWIITYKKPNNNNKILKRGSIISIAKEPYSFLIIEIWKSKSNKKWWSSPFNDTLSWPIPELVLKSKNYKIGIRKLQKNNRKTIYAECIDGQNVYKTYRILTDLSIIKKLISTVDI